MRIRFPSSIELRFVTATTIILALAVATVTLLNVRDTRSEARATAAAHLAADARVLRANVVGEIHEYAQDIQVLANTPPIAGIQRALANDGLDPESMDTLDDWRERLSEIFIAMLAGKSQYAEVRYLDPSGLELVRVERTAGQGVVISGSSTLDKSDREYFSVLRAMRPGDVYVVPIQLHAHRDETAQTPIVTFATPVNAPEGGFAGAVVTDIYGRDLLASFVAAGGGTSYLVDHTGRYVFHPAQSDLLPTSDGSPLSLDDDFGPDVVERFAGGAGTFTASGRLFAQVPVEIPGVVTTAQWWVLKEVPLAALPVPGLTGPLSAAALIMVAGAAVSFILAHGVSRSLRESEQRYRTLTETSASGIIVTDAGSRVTFANPAACEMFGYSQKQFVGLNLYSLVHPDDLHQIEEARGAIFAGAAAPRRYEGRRLRKDGSTIRVETVATPWVEDGEAAGAFIQTRDITEEKGLREQLLVAQKSEALGTLVAGVAHDFNNILTAIGGAIDLARRERPGSQWLEGASESTDRAAELVRQLLQFARHEAPNRSPLPLLGVVEQCVDMVRETFDRRIEVEVEADQSLPLVDGDAGQLQQVLMNLLVNARDAVLEHAERRGRGSDYRPRIELRLTTEWVDASNGGAPRQRVVFSVADNGVGMEAEVRERIFDPFFTTKKLGEGTGLGLSTAYGIVAEHGGSLTVHSEAGKGTAFTITLPASVEQTVDTAVVGDLPSPPAEREKGSVLLVDDELVILKVVKAALASYGYDVVAVSNGQDAMHAMAGRRFDLAVLDVSMPAPDGWEVLAQMKESSPEMPVLMTSGYAVEREVRARGACGFLEKPYRLDTLVRTIGENIGEATGSAA